MDDDELVPIAKGLDDDDHVMLGTGVLLCIGYERDEGA